MKISRAVAISSAPVDSREVQPPAAGMMSAPRTRSAGLEPNCSWVCLLVGIERLCVEVGHGEGDVARSDHDVGERFTDGDTGCIPLDGTH